MKCKDLQTITKHVKSLEYLQMEYILMSLYHPYRPMLTPHTGHGLEEKLVKSHIQIDVLGYMPSDERRDLS